MGASPEDATAHNGRHTAKLKIGAVVIVSMLLTLTWVSVVLVRAQNDPKAFIVMGSIFQEHDPRGTKGYDGQFAYYIALEGLDSQAKLDVPSYRLQRILYPLTVKVLSFGNARLVPWMMIVLNVIALAVTVGCLAAWFIRYQRPPWYALIFALWVGVIFTIRFDLNELLCMAFGIAGLMFIHHRQLYMGVVCLGLSVLAKDMGFVFIATSGLYLFFNGERRVGIIVSVLGLLPYVIWAFIVRLSVAVPEVLYGGTIPSVLPLQGYANAKTPIELILMIIWLILPALVLGAMALVYAVRHPSLLSGWFMIAAAVWVIYMPAASAYDPIASFRVAMPLVPAGLLFAAEMQMPRVLYILSALWAPAVIAALIVPGFWG